MHMEELDEFYLEWEEDSELALDNPLCRQILWDAQKNHSRW